MTLILVYVVVGAAMTCAGTWGGWHFGHAYGWHEGSMTERERWIERGRRERERKLGPPPRVGPGQPGKRAEGPGGLLNSARSFPSAPPRRRVATTVADLAPVVVPEPGTLIPFRPQPARTSGAGTQTMPRLTDTGELRALADTWAEKTRREQAVWAHEYAARCEADRQEAGLTP